MRRSQGSHRPVLRPASYSGTPALYQTPPPMSGYGAHDSRTQSRSPGRPQGHTAMGANV
jgi:hypothetical protein